MILLLEIVVKYMHRNSTASAWIVYMQARSTVHVCTYVERCANAPRMYVHRTRELTTAFYPRQGILWFLGSNGTPPSSPPPYGRH